VTMATVGVSDISQLSQFGNVRRFVSESAASQPQGHCLSANAKAWQLDRPSPR